MLPTNSGKAKDQGCSPVSSNCVVWQGPDLGCIGLCKGDTVSDVIAKLATELCTLIDMFNIEDFDLACLAIPTSETPADVGALIQILVNRVCALEGIDPLTPTGTTGDCPDGCIVPIADCFYYTDPRGDVVTTMTLTDYVTAIGNRICDILNDITILQNAVDTLQQQQLDTSGAIKGLEDGKASKSSLEYQLNTKTDPTGATKYITEATRSIENSLIGTQDAIGSSTLLYQNILKQGNMSDEERLYGNGPMSGITGWTNNVQYTADSLGNAWLAIRDLRSEVAYIKENCCSSGCGDLYLNFRASITGSLLTIFTDGSTGFTSDWAECTGVSKVTVTDAFGNSSTFSTSLITLMGIPSGYTFELAPTSVDFTTNLTVVADTCFINKSTDTTCNSDYSDTIINSPACPTAVLTVYSTSVNYQFNTTSGYTYIVNVYYNGGGVPVATQLITTPGAIIFQSILGLLSSTDYELEIIAVDSKGGETACPKQAFTTLAAECQPPINASAMITI